MHGTETFRLFIENRHCKYIKFGGCHDNGYVPFLGPHSKRALHTTHPRFLRLPHLLESVSLYSSRLQSFLWFSVPVRCRQSIRAQLPRLTAFLTPPLPAMENRYLILPREMLGFLKSTGRERFHSTARVKDWTFKLPEYQYKAAVYLKRREKEETLCYDHHLLKRTLSHSPMVPEQVLVLRHWMRKIAFDQSGQWRFFGYYYSHVCPYPLNDCNKGLFGPVT